MQINIEDMLFELLRYDRNTRDKAQVDRVVKMAARAIETMERETPRDVIRMMFEMSQGGHA
jgi:hypothetical protein